jgi:hypothetical protein
MNNFEEFNSDRERLIAFLNDTYQLLRNIYTEGVDPRGNPIVPEDLMPLLRNAWREFVGNFNLNREANRIREAPEDRLVSHGLYGAQLTLKLTLIDRLRASWFDLGGDSILKKLIDAIDTLLNSLIAATGIDEAIREIKEAISNWLD